MISVTFTADVENIVATEHLYQWDNGQKLSISGVGTTADIHFANKKSEKALVITPTVTSGAMVAFIPNSLLAEPYPIIAYVYVPSDNGSKTIKSVTIYVEARKQPSDFVLEEDVGVTTIETISQRANEVLQNATNQINTAVSNMQTDYTNFKNTIHGELADMVANTTIPNADTLDGKHAESFMQWLGAPSDIDFMNNANYQVDYHCTMGDGTRIGLPIAGWYHIVYYHQVNPPENSGYGMQIAYPLNFDSDTYIRRSDSTTWTNWKNIANGGNADTVDGKHASDFALKTDIPTSLPANGGNADTANTAGTLATTPTNVCLRNISFGTADPQVTDSSAEGYVAEGALYGQYT